MHLVVDVSAHGYGHLSLTAPVLAELRRLVPGLRLTIRSALPRPVIAARVAEPFEHRAEAFDFGMVMKGPLDVDVAASARAYAELHEGFDRRADLEAARLVALGPDLLLSNIPYLSLAAARRAGVPAAALCCLNWAEIYGPICGGEPGAEAIHRAMVDAYASGLFLRPEPSMPMPGLGHATSVGPIAALGAGSREELRAALGVGAGERLVVVALGGVPARLPMEAWPEVPGVRWLVPAEWNVQRRDAAPFAASGQGFTDLLTSCDAVIAKPGYGTFTEAACNGIPVLRVPRPGWPEAPCLVEWLEAHGRSVEIGRAEVERGEVGEALERLWATPEKARPRPTGAGEAARILAGVMGE